MSIYEHLRVLGKPTGLRAPTSIMKTYWSTNTYGPQENLLVNKHLRDYES